MIATLRIDTACEFVPFQLQEFLLKLSTQIYEVRNFGFKIADFHFLSTVIQALVLYHHYPRSKFDSNFRIQLVTLQVHLSLAHIILADPCINPFFV